MLTFNNPPKPFTIFDNNPRNRYLRNKERNRVEEPKPIAPVEVDGNLLFLWHILKLSDCTFIPMDQIALIFGLTHEKATECYVDLKHAIETAVYDGAIQKIVRTRHDPGYEQPPTSIFTFVDNKIRGRCKKPMSKPNLKKEIDAVLQGRIGTLTMSLADAGMARDPTFVSVLPSTEQAKIQQRTSESDTRRLPSIHELNPFEPQSHVFNLPGKFSIRFGPANVFPVPSATNGQRMVTGAQQQQSQQPMVTRGQQVPGSNNRNTPIPGPSSRTRPGPAPAPNTAASSLEPRSLQTTASLALSASASTSSTRPPGSFNRGPNAGAGLTTAVGQAKPGNATGSTKPAMGQFQGSIAAQSSKGKGKRVRTASETESEEDIYS